MPVSAAASHAISDTQRFGYAPSLMVWMAGYAERSLRTKNHADLAIENRSKECELSQLDADADGEQRKEILTWGGPISISAPAKPMPCKRRRCACRWAECRPPHGTIVAFGRSRRLLADFDGGRADGHLAASVRFVGSVDKPKKAPRLCIAAMWMQKEI